MRENESPCMQMVRHLTFQQICFPPVLSASPVLCSHVEITETVLPEQMTVPEMNTLATKVKSLHPLLPLEGGSPDRGTCVIERKCQLPFKSDC